MMIVDDIEVEKTSTCYSDFVNLHCYNSQLQYDCLIFYLGVHLPPYVGVKKRNKCHISKNNHPPLNYQKIN